MFKKIAEFFTGKKPEVAPEAPYKVEVTPVTASVTDTVIITPEAVAPTLVSDTIVTEPTQSKPVVKRGTAKTTAKPKAPAKAPTKAPRAIKALIER